MPTSQNFDTSNKYIKYKIEVTVNSQSIENNTSNITVKVWFFRTNQGYTTFGSGTCYCTINGTSYSQAITSSQKITSSPIALFTRTVDIPHDNDGSKSVWVSAYISHNAPLSSSDQGFSAGLPRIPRAAVFTGADDFTDEQNPKIYFNNPAGFRLQLKMEAGGDDYLIVRDNLVNPSSPYTFELTADERNKLRAKTPNSNKLTVRFTVATYMPGASRAGDHSYGDKTMSIVNANPVFSPSQLSYEDTNSNTLAVTNNNQLIVRNQSQLRASFASATAQKSASISKYQIIFNGNLQDKTSAGTYDLGPVDSSSSLKLQVKAIDSRGNSTTVSKTVQILDWVLPIINSSAKRVNNYEDETKLKSDVDISSVKNLNFLRSLQYRTKKVSDSAWGSWINFQNNTETTVILDKLFAWNLEIKALDKFGTSSQSLIIPKGMPILFFDTKKLSVGVNCFPEKIESFEISGKTIFDMVYPIGSIYMSVNSTNPGAIFGGTWESWGQGRVPVGVNTNDLDFNAVEKSGGNKNHAHILGDNAAAMIGSDEQAGNSIAYAATNVGIKNGTTYTVIGTNNNPKAQRAHNTRLTGWTNNTTYLPPYITCYMWKRTG